MATQGLVSFVDKNYNVLAKVVVGCNGFNADRFIEHVDKLDPEYLWNVALDYQFGCDDCLIVSTNKSLHYHNDMDISESKLYYTKFDDPGFNPRWEYGTADYVRIIIWE